MFRDNLLYLQRPVEGHRPLFEEPCPKTNITIIQRAITSRRKVRSTHFDFLYTQLRGGKGVAASFSGVAAATPCHPSSSAPDDLTFLCEAIAV